MNINELNEDNFLLSQESSKFYELSDVVNEVIKEVISSDLTRVLIEERVKSMEYDITLPETSLGLCVDNDIDGTIDLFLNSGTIIDGIEYSSRKEEIENHSALIESLLNEIENRFSK